VVLMSWWPRMSWAMCGGIPVRMASMAKTLRKSWGRKSSGLPSGPAMPAAASAPVMSSRMPPEGTGLPGRRAAGTAARRRRVPGALVGVAGGGVRDGPAGAADPGDDRGQDVGQFRVDDGVSRVRVQGTVHGRWGKDHPDDLQRYGSSSNASV
jgi:hypothetical protein